MKKNTFILLGIILCMYPVLGDIGCVISNYPQIAVLALMCMLLLMCVSFKQTFRLTLPDMLFFLYWLWMIICMIIHHENLDPLNIASTVYLIFVYFLIRNMNQSQIKKIVYILFLSGILQAVIALCQLMGILQSNHSSFDFTGSFHNPGPLSGFLLPLFFLGIYLLKQQIQLKRSFLIIVIYGVGILLLFSVLLLSYSRSAWVAILVVGALFLIRKYRRTKLTVVIIILLIPIFCCFYHFKKESAAGRLVIWKSSLEMIKESPFVGIGAYSFPRHYMYYQAAYFHNCSNDKEKILADNVYYSFNEGIRIWVENGAIGLLLFLGSMAAILYPLGCSYKPDKEMIDYTCISLLIFGLFSYPGSIEATKLLFIILCAILVNLNNYRSICLFKNRNFVKRIGYVAIIFGISFHLNQLLIYHQGIKELRIFLQNASKANPEILEKSYETFKYNAEYLLFYSSIVYDRKKSHSTLSVMEQLAQLQPSSFLLSDIGECYFHLGNYTKAEHSFRLATEMTPGYVTPHYKLFSFYKKTENYNRAAELAQYIITAKYKKYGSVAIFAKKEAKLFIDTYEKQEHTPIKEGGESQ